MAPKTIGFVEFAGKIEPQALGGAIARDAHDRRGDLVVRTVDSLEADGVPLNQKQKTALASNAFRLFSLSRCRGTSSYQAPGNAKGVPLASGASSSVPR